MPWDYKPIIKSGLPLNDLPITSENINVTIEKLKNLLVGSIALSQQRNWVLITQLEVYFKDRSIDDVAVVTRYDRYPAELEVNVENCQEGRGSWLELRLNYDRFKIIATGGLYNDKSDPEKCGAFLGVAAPIHMANNNHFLLFVPRTPDCTYNRLPSNA